MSDATKLAEQLANAAVDEVWRLLDEYGYLRDLPLKHRKSGCAFKTLLIVSAATPARPIIAPVVEERDALRAVYNLCEQSGDEIDAAMDRVRTLDLAALSQASGEQEKRLEMPYDE